MEQLAGLDPNVLSTADPATVQMAQHRAEWLQTARANQLPPLTHDWFVWLALAGRGFGKTRSGAEDSSWFMSTYPESRIALVAPTFADGRDTMVEGESGILSSLPGKMIDKWSRSIGELVLTNGSMAKIFTGEEPQRLRGPQFHRAWADELCAWKYMEDTWDMLLMTLRLGVHPQVIVTTTPKPYMLIRNLIKDEDTVVVSGSTYENEANLPPSFLKKLREKYEGTRLGRQELLAEILNDFENAFLRPDQIKHIRPDERPHLTRIGVSIDPAAKYDKDKSDETGIIIGGIDNDRNGYVIDDKTGHYTPEEWAIVALNAYDDYDADFIVAESNNGGEMVRQVIEDKDPSGIVPVKLVTATRGKQVRAEPITMKYEQGKIMHVGDFPVLEDQLCAYSPAGYELEGSPDHGDAAVWLFTELLVTGQELQLHTPLSLSRVAPGIE